MPSDEWRPAVSVPTADVLTRLARKLIYEAHREWGNAESPRWRFYLHPAAYDSIFHMLATGNYTPYVFAGVEVEPPSPVVSVDRHGYVLRLFGLLVLPDPVMDPANLELRYTLAMPLLTNEPKEMDHDGYPSHP